MRVGPRILDHGLKAFVKVGHGLGHKTVQFKIKWIHDSDVELYLYSDSLYEEKKRHYDIQPRDSHINIG